MQLYNNKLPKISIHQSEAEITVTVLNDISEKCHVPSIFIFIIYDVVDDLYLDIISFHGNSVSQMKIGT